MPSPPSNPSTPESAFFTANYPPSTLTSLLDTAAAFIHAHPARRIALVTSGGTSIPLERHTVRFLDNFSAGTRGATSAEQLLAAGYAVIFLHRKGTLTPFARRLPSEAILLDLLQALADPSSNPANAIPSNLKAVLDAHATTVREETLCKLSYTTVTEYLFALRSITQHLAAVGPRALCYLAAAVSDFYIPDAHMVEHKIQSGGADDDIQTAPAAAQVQGERLVITLEPVPKLLGTLRRLWAPEALVISFKLETDPEMLLRKAHRALERDGHNLVIGNLLDTRASEVVFVSNEGEAWIRKPEQDAKVEIEAQLIPRVAMLHDQYIKTSVALNASGDNGQINMR